VRKVKCTLNEEIWKRWWVRSNCDTEWHKNINNSFNNLLYLVPILYSSTLYTIGNRDQQEKKIPNFLEAILLKGYTDKHNKHN
jgi:hypothetical protein